MEDCTEFHQSEINRKIKANDKLRKIITTMPDEHRALIYGDSFQSKVRSFGRREGSPLAEKQKIHLERTHERHREEAADTLGKCL